MKSLNIDKDILEDLVNTKLRTLQIEIQEILAKWHYDDIQKFLHDAKDGTIEDAEDDAICLKNLIEKQERFYNMRNQWSSN